MFHIVNSHTNLIDIKFRYFEHRMKKTYQIDTWIPSNRFTNLEIIKWVNFVHAG